MNLETFLNRLDELWNEVNQNTTVDAHQTKVVINSRSGGNKVVRVYFDQEQNEVVIE